jgi:hypothetical protein
LTKNTTTALYSGFLAIEKSPQILDKPLSNHYNITVFITYTKTQMKNKIKAMDRLQVETMSVRSSYTKEQDVMRSTHLLRVRSKKLHALLEMEREQCEDLSLSFQNK